MNCCKSFFDFTPQVSRFFCEFKPELLWFGIVDFLSSLPCPSAGSGLESS